VRTPCPVCGTPVRAEAHVTDVTVEHAWLCPRCGKFTINEDVQARLAALDPGRRLALSRLLRDRGSWDARGARLEPSDL
jgi:hypothetical protein